MTNESYDIPAGKIKRGDHVANLGIVTRAIPALDHMHVILVVRTRSGHVELRSYFKDDILIVLGNEGVGVVA